MRFVYWKSCAELADHELQAHDAMIADAVEVTYKTFRKHADRLDEWASVVGYDSPHTKVGLPLSRDWHIGYFRSHWRGVRCYFLVWSAFEHMWRAG